MCAFDHAAGGDMDREWRERLGLGPHFTLDELITRVRESRGRPMEIIEMPELVEHGDALCGLWLATDERDIVIHAPSESALHRQQFILHEMAHMILQHDKTDFVFTPRGLLPDVDESTVVKVLARDSINDDFELAAERLADELADAIRGAGRSKFLDIFG